MVDCQVCLLQHVSIALIYSLTKVSLELFFSDIHPTDMKEKWVLLLPLLSVPLEVRYILQKQFCYFDNK